jgi:hypothetical protein
VLQHWPAAEIDASMARHQPFTSVASWRGAFAPVVYDGHTYGLRVHEFRKFFDLPLRSHRPFEMALKIDSVEQNDLGGLKRNNWRLVEPCEVAGSPDAYRDYVRRSAAEFMVAKNMYIDTRGGWFSDRSICYLASGRPVLAQDTGLADLYDIGEGLLTFTTPDEAAADVATIDGDYAHHARAARRLAERYFDSDKVLSDLLRKLGVTA